MKHLKIIAYVFIAAVVFCSCSKDEFSGDSGAFTDARDGQEYKWARIGEQIWMAENLAYMPYVCPADSQCGIWVYDYEDDKPLIAKGQANYHTYGCLYDWQTAIEVCLDGWHLPSDEEWMELESFLGMPTNQLNLFGTRGHEINVAGKLKSSGIGFWGTDIVTNETGFSALPSGYREGNRCYALGISASFWTSSEDSNEYPIGRFIRPYWGSVDRETQNKTSGFSIRYVKN